VSSLHEPPRAYRLQTPVAIPKHRCSSDIGEGRTFNVMSAYTCEYSEWRVMD